MFLQTTTTRYLLLAALFVGLTTAFAPTSKTTNAVSTTLFAQENEDFMRWARQSRSAGSDDTVVELMRPLGLVLNQDDNGNVYVETVAPRGNAARTGKVRFDTVRVCLTMRRSSQSALSH